MVDTADSRVQITLENQAVAQLPMIGRNLVTLVTMAPGVSGLGTSATGSPASGVDNFSTEEQVDASANGQGQNNNQYVIDGLDVTSGIRQGVLNLTPQPESIQETSIQVNTFSSEYSRAAGLQTMFTTGLEQTRSTVRRRTGSITRECIANSISSSGYIQAFPLQQHGLCGRRPDHSPPQQFLLFCGRAVAFIGERGGSVTFADPQFISFAQTNYPTQWHPCAQYVLALQCVGVHVSQTAQDIFGSGRGRVRDCGRKTACRAPAHDRQGSFGATQIRNGTQYFARIDQGFKSDRIYVSLFELSC